MSVCRHELGEGVQPQRPPSPPRQFSSCLEANEEANTRRINEKDEATNIFANWFVYCKPLYNRTYEPPWETDSPPQASETKRPMEREMIEFVGPNRDGGQAKLS